VTDDFVTPSSTKVFSYFLFQYGPYVDRPGPGRPDNYSARPSCSLKFYSLGRPDRAGPPGPCRALVPACFSATRLEVNQSKTTPLRTRDRCRRREKSLTNADSISYSRFYLKTAVNAKLTTNLHHLPLHS